MIGEFRKWGALAVTRGPYLPIQSAGIIAAATSGPGLRRRPPVAIKSCSSVKAV